ncbi:MAG: 4-(cytidine 5'-diphospho)-2-C-methyl-D-erythritol kinase [Planctomycetota bacterium]
MRRSAPAKLNLDLHVGPLGADGFHPIRSHFVTVGLCDHVTIKPGSDGITFRTNAEDVAEDNLCVRAAEAFDETFGLPGAGVDIELEKRIPIGGGLGGGSSDAATTLLMLAEMAGVERNRLMPIAAELGSDVPFFVSGHASAICTGRGEIVEPTDPPAEPFAVLMMPGIHVATPRVFQRFDDLGGEPPNDLQHAAFDLHPELADLQEVLERGFGRPFQLTGSGSTLFTLCDDADLTTQIAEAAPCDALAVDVCPGI